MKEVIAVLDIGKTNKKIAVYDRQLTLLELRSATFPAVDYEDVRVEQVENIEAWFLSAMKELSKGYRIAAVSISAHGAAAVCVGRDGLPAVPVLDYTTEIPEKVHKDFFDVAGPTDVLQRETCTAEIRPLINVAKLLFFTRRRFPEEFKRVESILLYPQYFAFRLTGIKCADYTYVGCHTYLWDFTAGGWSDVARRLEMVSYLPERVDSPTGIAGHVTEEVSRRTGLSPQTPVLIGVHDSNSSLLPYLYMGQDDFILNSTGTWCVAMHPKEEAVLRESDIGKTVFFNLSVNNVLVKTAIFMGGLEFERWFGLLQKIHKRSDYPQLSEKKLRAVVEAADDFILPGVVQGAGQYPHSLARVVSRGREYRLSSIEAGEAVPDLFGDYEKAFMVLLLSLTLHTRVAFERTGLRPGIPIYTEGGFRQNWGYNAILAALLPDNPVYTTEIEEAASYGAAWLGWAAIEYRDLSNLSEYTDFKKKLVTPMRIVGIESYAQRFFSLLDDGVTGEG